MATKRQKPRAPKARTTENHVESPADFRYPVNEVMLKTLLCSGRSGAEIARLCSVTPAAVAHMRDAYGI